MTDFDRIIEDFRRVVWKQALRMLGNESDAADCLQTVFLEAFELSTRQPVRNWAGLLKRLATLRSLDLLRTRYRQATVPLPEELVQPASAFAGIDSLDYQELGERLRRALTLLPENQSEAFTLKGVGELSNEEIAEQMQVTANHVGVLLHRARATLSELLSRERTLP